MRQKLRFILGSLTVLVVLPLVAVAGLYDSALQLDGVNDYATAADNASLDLGVGSTEDFTIEAFFYVSDLTATTTQNLVYKTQAYNLFIIHRTATPDIIRFRLTSALITLDGTANLTAGWHHVAAVFDNEFTDSNDLMAIYLDGSRINAASNFEISLNTNSASAVGIGALPNGAQFFPGYLDEIRLSNTVRYSGLTYTVPSANFDADSNTRALWHFDAAPGATSFSDSSGNGNNLTALNGATTGSPNPSVPGAPTDVTGMPGNTTVALSWTAPANNGGAAITGYQVQVATSAGGTYTDATGCPTNSTTPSCTATGLTNGTPYFFKVAAINSVGPGAYSAVSGPVTPAPTVLLPILPYDRN